jgi:hypothetical protein
VPDKHDAPAGQLSPQPPQFFGSSAVSTQDVPHSGSPTGHVQSPLVQTWPAGQALPHAPQLALLLVVLTHTPLQRVKPVAHAQTPPAQL